MGCASCGQGFHWECRKCGKGKCHVDIAKISTAITPTATGRVGAPVKSAEDVRDPKSTGRKEAAIRFPIIRGPNGERPDCEWQGLKNCGGGLAIVGCINGKQVDRHHGPDKNTLNNAEGNVHRICKTCHNRWHAVNDGPYNAEEWMKTSHSPEPATSADLIANEAKWRMKS